MVEETNKSIRRRRPAAIEVPPGEVRILESHHADDFEMETGAWPFHKICWVAVGRGTLQSTDGAVEIRKDDFLLLPADWAHRFVDVPAEPLTLVMFCISRQYVAGHNVGMHDLWERVRATLVPGRAFCARTGFHRSRLVEGFRLALLEQGQALPGWQSALAILADQLVLNLARGFCESRDLHVDSSKKTVAGAIDFIDRHLYAPLQIKEMADRCHLSPRRFTDLFRELSGESFNQYVNRKRIQYACERLDETGHILYACHESGFNDLAYFYRVFRKLTGRTPGQYLKARRGR